MEMAPSAGGPANLADILERVLDKGIVIAGDIQINLLDIELLTIKLRLLVASVERAQEMGINWWESDPTLSRGGQGARGGESATCASASIVSSSCSWRRCPRATARWSRSTARSTRRSATARGDVIEERHERHDDVRVEGSDA